MSYPTLSLLLGGVETGTGSLGRDAILDPATEEVLAEAPQAGAVEARQAAALALEGFAEWSALSALERAKVMRRAADLMRAEANEAALTLSQEQGKILAQARGEWLASADLLDWFAEEGRRAYGRVIPSRARNQHWEVRKRPVGPVLALAPWNFPAWTVMQKVAPALAAGCSVVVKPAENTPATALRVARCLLAAGLPPKAISVIWGDPGQIASTLVAAPEIRKVTLTGSTRVGRIIAAEAGQQLKKATMELGGHAPVIVARDADVAAAARLAVEWKFRNAGQVCVSPTRFLVEAPVHDAFLEEAVRQASALRVGPGQATESQMGPLATRRQLDHVLDLVADARARGASIACGGTRLGDRGYFLAPTIVADATPELKAMNVEPFGPLALVMKVASIEEALAEANRLPIGLASYAFTDSRRTAETIASGIKAGMLGINTFAMAMPETPFGGVLDSGMGSEGGLEGLEAFLMPFTISSMV